MFIHPEADYEYGIFFGLDGSYRNSGGYSHDNRIRPTGDSNVASRRGRPFMDDIVAVWVGSGIVVCLWSIEKFDSVDVSQRTYRSSGTIYFRDKSLWRPP